MPQTVEIVFASFEDLAARISKPDSGTLVAFAGEDLALSHATRNLLGSAADLVGRAAAAARFLREVDASCVLRNASTRLNDGGCLGLGAEIGISTSKLHAYGPMGLRELTTKKYVVEGEGTLRAPAS